MNQSERSAPPTPSEACYWLRDEDGNDQTNCGGAWCLNDGTPPENGMKYCPYCGKPIEWSDYCGDDTDDE